MTSDGQRIPAHILPRLQAAFDKLKAIEDDPDIDWVALLELRGRADPLSDDAWYRGYLVGVLDALGVSVAEAVQVLRTTATGQRPRKRIIQLNRTG